MPGDNDDAQALSAQQPAQGQKFLRYRSVRQSAAVKEDPAASQDPPPPLPQTSQTSLTRLPSRYHRRPPPAPQSAPSPTAEPPLPASLNNTATVSRPRGQTVNGATTEQDGAWGRQTQNGTTRRMVIQHSDSRPPTARPTTSKSTPRKQTLTSSVTPPSPDELRRSLEAAREEARLLLEGEQDRVRALRQQEARRRHEEREKRRRQEEKLAQEARQREAEEAARQEARKRPGRPQRPEQGVDEQREAAALATSDAVLDSNKSRTRTMVIGGQPPSNTEGKRAHHQRASSTIEQLQQKPKQSHTRTRSAGKNDEKPDNEAPVLKPNFDAPVSAVNAGERRVSVKCKEAFVTLPVTPSTTSKDILSSASVCMSERIDPSTAVLLESFAQLGLERPLRRYERIRDVMNSWDNDTQNHLFIMAEGECAAPGLQVADAPNQQPYETVVNIYHSQKPGKWDKRWLRLREDGQITTSKNENGIDSTNICHLSDFDLYTPTARQIKKLKPPKKLCFALKSQEKSAMFLDGANFVHFFCTKDKTVADRWYHAVHSWRSWYLVNMLGEGQQKPTDSAERFKLGSRPGTRGSKESLPYVLGSFKPLLDFGSAFEGNRKPEPDVAHRPSQSDDRRPLIDFVPERPSIDEKPSSPKFPSRPQGVPPTSFPRKFMIESATSANVDDTDGPFTGTGLLARSASRRSQGGQRSSRGAPGKPLVDLTLTSEFTDGSLLRKMEAMAPHQGAMEPKIDRQKRREVDIVVGEGF
ncbi:uncharacterized protein Z520_06966 [Fonsecaea multimorphosa CBS 102226]|uniref:Uncharacterized protein n=1 Tax=Fonsecaea multimorphosa CBS 102226 TaxID=1442371 RepID=A0A0D2K327_9EURO|nr:uncharacterized protein Z520_06966 [Fonsecaea multimorphosa CBS 102226]KIX97514.1 hypothetical protein Z520_06966 [Fonsecaea multimorphosa CBS 102226]OAL23475.1 hypothetical protein AYO22_06525 [Fonsecaea multimorphosa]